MKTLPVVLANCRYSFLFAAFLIALPALGGSLKYSVMEFPDPPGHHLLRPTGINNKGEVVFSASTILNSTNIHVAANYIGTSSSGNASLGGTAGGVFAEAVHDLLIGDTNRLSVINAETAVSLKGVTGSGSGGSRIDNCHIGLRASGTAVLGGTTNGLHIERSLGLTVGGLVRNVMAGIPSVAVKVLDSTNVHLAGNYIGTASNGTTSLPVGMGIQAIAAREFRIGASNLLTVNNGRTAGELSQLSAASNAGAFAGRMFNCYIGLSANGTNSLNGTTNGISISDSEGFEIGGTESAFRNVFAGIVSNSLSLLRVTNVAVRANHFGTDRLGLRALANRSAHIFLDSVRNVTIGTTNAISAICGSGTDGIAIRDSQDATVQNASVGLLLGGTQTGSGNGSNGISSVTSRGVRIGGSHPTQRVLVSRNGRHGIEARDTHQFRVENCIIGSGTNRTEAFGNSLSGVRVYGSLAGQIFAESAATLLKGNSILFNQKSGIELSQEAPITQPHEAVHVVQGNDLRSNVEDGVRISEGVGSVTLGGSGSGEGNTILQNGGSGIRINNPGERVLVEVNCVFSNFVNAIERTLDAQTQIQQQITNATKGSTLVQGTVSGRPNQMLRMHFYAHRPKAGAQGEGEMWLGSLNVQLNGSGGGSYDQRLPRTAPTGWRVASTATDPLYGTAEFSPSQIVQLPTDTDGDGLPDFWEALYPSCLDPLVADPPNEDCDGDGFTNKQEYIAHTGPTKADSALKVETLEASGDGATLNFTGVAGRQYGLERRTDLATGAWLRVATMIPEADGEVSLADPNPPPGHSYYRLVAEIP